MIVLLFRLCDVPTRPGRVARCTVSTVRQAVSKARQGKGEAMWKMLKAGDLAYVCDFPNGSSMWTTCVKAKVLAVGPVGTKVKITGRSTQFRVGSVHTIGPGAVRPRDARYAPPNATRWAYKPWARVVDDGDTYGPLTLVRTSEGVPCRVAQVKDLTVTVATWASDGRGLEHYDTVRPDQITPIRASELCPDCGDCHRVTLVIPGRAMGGTWVSGATQQRCRNCDHVLSHIPHKD